MVTSVQQAGTSIATTQKYQPKGYFEPLVLKIKDSVAWVFQKLSALFQTVGNYIKNVGGALFPFFRGKKVEKIETSVEAIKTVASHPILSAASTAVAPLESQIKQTRQIEKTVEKPRIDPKIVAELEDKYLTPQAKIALSYQKLFDRLSVASPKAAELIVLAIGDKEWKKSGWLTLKWGQTKYGIGLKAISENPLVLQEYLTPDGAAKLPAQAAQTTLEETGAAVSGAVKEVGPGLDDPLQ